MFITISMLTEALGDFEFSEMHIEKRDRISSIRVFTGEPPLQKEILYLFPVQKEQQVRCRTAGGTSFCVLTDLFSLLNQIMKVFDDYSRWQTRLSRAVESGCTLTELLNLSYPVIRHPLSILDANEWGIAHSDLSLSEEIDADWTDLVQKHTSDTEKIAAFNVKYYKYFNLRHVYHIPGNIFGDGYACNLFHNQTFCGVMIMAAPGQMKDVTQGELDALQYLGDLICNMISINSFDADIQLPEKPFFEYLLNKEADSLEKLERSLGIASWEKQDPKWVIYSEALESGYLAPKPSHSKMMFNRIDGIVTAEFRTGLVFLCNLRILKSRENAKTMLSEHLRQISYYAGSSSEFYDLAFISSMLEQAQISLENSPQINGRISQFEDSVTAYLISMLKKVDGGVLKHPCLEMLQNYDRRYGSKLYETLYLYLKNERKLSKTMEELDVPRSTLLNRLRRIDELLDLQLDQPEVRLHILLSYMLYEDTTADETI